MEPTSGLILSSLSLAITIPIFITIYRHLPVYIIPFGEGFRIDHFFVFILVFAAVYFALKKFTKFVLLIAILGIVGIFISSISGYYGFRNFYYDYASMLYALKENGVQLKFEEDRDPFSRQAYIVKAVDYNHPKVREMAMNWAAKNFQEYKNVSPSLTAIHSLSIFKEVRKRWVYISDPVGEDYYASASETFNLLSEDNLLKGDCDDYSIVMASLVKAIGGRVRLVRTLVTLPNGSKAGHLYPEVLIGTFKDLEQVAYLIKNKLFVKESFGKTIYYYIDASEQIWLNFDYNDHYPGAHYQSLVRESVLEL